MMGDYDARHEAILDLCREAAADGVIFERLMFCDPWGADQHNLAHRSKAPGALPVLFLTREYGIVPTGQLRTRVQAFVERLEIGRAQGRGAPRQAAGPDLGAGGAP
jgi:benzoyl-CoA reductase/2-hydroxyglutaryl-CoA dehydratase subunit BcrC/BadD/HgdB